VDSYRSCVITCAKELVLAFEVPAGVILTVKVRDRSGKTVLVPFITRTADRMEIRSFFTGPGDYLLISWASSAARPQDYSWAFTYLVRSRF
jgi:hypothetical protein